MSVMILLLMASLSVAAIFLGAFLWSVRARQFEDDFSPPQRILFDESPFTPGAGHPIPENEPENIPFQNNTSTII